MELVWHDPEWEEFQCAGCFAPTFRKIATRGRKQEFCTPLCQAAVGNRRHRAKQKENVR
jgi:hypothetical protein